MENVAEVSGVEFRMLRGESVDALSRELAVPIFRLEEWQDRALTGIDTGLKERDQTEGRRTAVGWSRAQRGMRLCGREATG